MIFNRLQQCNPASSWRLIRTRLGPPAPAALHEHPVFTIDNGGAGVPLDGVYLIAPTATVAGLTDSQPVYMVWLVDALFDEEDAAEGLEASLEQGQTVYLGKDFAFFEQAVDYVQNQLVPEPTSGLLSLLAFAGVMASGGDAQARSK